MPWVPDNYGGLIYVPDVNIAQQVAQNAFVAGQMAAANQIAANQMALGQFGGFPDPNLNPLSLNDLSGADLQRLEDVNTGVLTNNKSNSVATVSGSGYSVNPGAPIIGGTKGSPVQENQTWIFSPADGGPDIEPTETKMYIKSAASNATNFRFSAAPSNAANSGVELSNINQHVWIISAPLVDYGNSAPGLSGNGPFTISTPGVSGRLFWTLDGNNPPGSVQEIALKPWDATDAEAQIWSLR
ncbi:hypothetical protein B0H16DRAFT_1807905 [Mycena metata]|uniref:Uncharacterized protein n=1 Tax=Mycena metata TaxID=1033252 RepID=A0AAD7MF66_9AGAR|nr:hypothetical protein B0H16DRAFT_1807905 [Mycena metata]